MGRVSQELGSSEVAWTNLEIGNEKNGDTSTSLVAGDSEAQQRAQSNGRGCLYVSNPSVPIPGGIRIYPGFMDRDEEADILKDALNEKKYVREGFDQRRRVQRYRLPRTRSRHRNESGETEEAQASKYKAVRTATLDRQEVPISLIRLRDRLEEVTGVCPEMVAIEEFPVNSRAWYRRRKGRGCDLASKHVVTTFESNALCSTSSQDDGDPSTCDYACGCAVAEIPLVRSVIRHFNRPSRRKPQCWDLASPQHWTDIRMDRGCLIVRTDDFLHYWRSRYVATTTDHDVDASDVAPTGDDTVLILKFYTLPDDSATREEKPFNFVGQQQLQSELDDADDDVDAFGYMPRGDKDSTYQPETSSIPLLRQMLTIIVTTSPIKSNPSTELLENAMKTFVQGGPEFAYECPKVIVCGKWLASFSRSRTNL